MIPFLLHFYTFIFVYKLEIKTFFKSLSAFSVSSLNLSIILKADRVLVKEQKPQT